MPKYELIKETKLHEDGRIIYYTNKDGLYVSNSLSDNYEQALKYFNTIKKEGTLVPKIEVLETVEVA